MTESVAPWLTWVGEWQTEGTPVGIKAVSLDTLTHTEVHNLKQGPITLWACETRHSHRSMESMWYRLKEHWIIYLTWAHTEKHIGPAWGCVLCEEEAWVTGTSGHKHKPKFCVFESARGHWSCCRDQYIGCLGTVTSLIHQLSEEKSDPNAF